jgi:hypothetical protein
MRRARALRLDVVSGAVEDPERPESQLSAATIASPSAAGSGKSRSAVPITIKAGQGTLGSCASTSAGVDLNVFMIPPSGRVHASWPRSAGI